MYEAMDFDIEFEQEEDGRWIAEIPSLPGVLVYGSSREDAESRVQSLAFRVIADRLEREHATTDHVAFAAASVIGPARSAQGAESAAENRMVGIGRASRGLSSAADPGWLSAFTWAFHDGDEIGPCMLKHTGLRPEDL